MAIELIKCHSCGTRNASRRTVCFKCGASLSTEEPAAFNISSPGIPAFPYMNENLGRIVSQFVEKRIIGGPQLGQSDLWSEGVYAALFSVAFEVLAHSSSEKDSWDLERETKAIIEGTCAHAAPWVNARLAEDTWQSTGVRVEVDDAPLMRYRMLMYFDVAYGAMADRGYEADVARSHACFAILSQVVSELMKQYSTIDETTMKKYREIGLTPPSEEEARYFVQKAFECCQSMNAEIADLLEHYGK